MYERIACIGGATLDRTVAPLGRLRPGTSNPVRSEACAGGTARNVAEALARLGVPVSLYSRVGADAAGDAILEELMELGLALDGIDRVASSPTASYTAVLDESGELVYGLADMEILDALEPGWLRPIAESLRAHDLWIVDANLPRAVLEALAALTPAGVRIFADPVSVEKSKRLEPLLGRIEALFPDLVEAIALAGPEGDEPSAHSPAPSAGGARQASEPTDRPAVRPRDLAARIRRRGPGRVLVSLGPDGVFVEDPPRHERVPAMPPRAIVNVSGAGDCFLAGYVFAHLPTAAVDPVRCGLTAAALAVESPRTVPPELTAKLLLERYRSLA